MKYPISCLTKSSSSHKAIAPDWFIKSEDISGIKQIHKHFDVLGLKDFSIKSDFNYLNVSRIRNLFSYIEERMFLDCSSYSSLALMAIANTRHVISEINKNINKNCAVLTNNIVDDNNKVMFKAGTHIKYVFANMVRRLKNSVSDDYDHVECIENISKSLNSKKSYKIVFSTHPWDILTMSMRGIDSCQRWNNSRANHLIGSVLCPYVGIIYTTNGTKTKYGDYMINRSIVRLVKGRDSNKFHLYVEEPYINSDSKIYDQNDEDWDDLVVDTKNKFRTVLAEKIKNNNKIFYGTTNSTRNYYIPLSNVIRKISVGNRSYIDSGLKYN